MCSGNKTLTTYCKYLDVRQSRLILGIAEDVGICILASGQPDPLCQAAHPTINATGSARGRWPCATRCQIPLTVLYSGRGWRPFRQQLVNRGC